MDFYSPKELLTMHPQIANVWTTRDIGQLLHLGLVSGRKLNKNVRCEVLETDILELFKNRKKAG